MNAIDLCKQFDIDNIADLVMDVVELDNNLNIMKANFKIKDIVNDKKLESFKRDKEIVRILQGHTNSLCSKRELFVKKYDTIIAAKLTKQLIINTKAFLHDMEYKDISVVCKKGGVEINGEYFETAYRNYTK